MYSAVYVDSSCGLTFYDCQKVIKVKAPILNDCRPIVSECRPSQYMY